MSDDVEKMIETFETAIRDKPDYAFNLVGLAETVAKKGTKLRAAELVRRALAAARAIRACARAAAKCCTV